MGIICAWEGALQIEKYGTEWEPGWKLRSGEDSEKLVSRVLLLFNSGYIDTGKYTNGVIDELENKLFGGIGIE